MIAEITSGIVCFGMYEFYIRVTDDEGRIYFLQKSVPESEATEENINIWKDEAIADAIEYWNTNII
jgi:hypothetical protein